MIFSTDSQRKYQTLKSDKMTRDQAQKLRKTCTDFIVCIFITFPKGGLFVTNMAQSQRTSAAADTVLFSTIPNAIFCNRFRYN